jgi:hypothetical protein
MAGFDERQMERFSLKLSANLIVRGDDSDEELIVKTSDINSGGAFFSTGQPLPLGTKVKIDMVLPLEELKRIEGKQAKIEVSGDVVRTDKGGMAVTFNKNYQITRLQGEE